MLVYDTSWEQHMMQGIIGKKVDQMQGFLSDGTRVPITEISVADVMVVGMRKKDKNGYSALQLGIGTKKHPTKGEQGIARGAKLETTPLFLREVAVDSEEGLPELGSVVNPTEVLKPGDIIDVIGVSKGKGYAGVVKRHHFKGGPRTHGQSDRERAPGSIGQTTTPGRVYKGKRMAGRMGVARVTLKNLQVLDITNTKILIKGLVPGAKNSIVLLKKVGETKKFVPLYKEEVKEEAQHAS